MPFLTKARNIGRRDDCTEVETSSYIADLSPGMARDKRSPFLDTHCRHHEVRVTIHSGGETNLIRESLVHSIGASITKCAQCVLQEDGKTPLHVVGETKLCLTIGHTQLALEALVVVNLDVEVRAGVPFMECNDICLRPARKMITFGDGTTHYYGHRDVGASPHIACHADVLPIRRPQLHVLRSPIDAAAASHRAPLQVALSPDNTCDMHVSFGPDPEVPVVSEVTGIDRNGGVCTRGEARIHKEQRKSNLIIAANKGSTVRAYDEDVLSPAIPDTPCDCGGEWSHQCCSRSMCFKVCEHREGQNAEHCKSFDFGNATEHGPLVNTEIVPRVCIQSLTLTDLHHHPLPRTFHAFWAVSAPRCTGQDPFSSSDSEPSALLSPREIISSPYARLSDETSEHKVVSGLDANLSPRRRPARARLKAHLVIC